MHIHTYVRILTYILVHGTVYRHAHIHNIILYYIPIYSNTFICTCTCVSVVAVGVGVCIHTCTYPQKPALTHDIV